MLNVVNSHFPDGTPKKHLKIRTKTIPKIKVLLFFEKYLFGSFFEGIMV